MSDERTAAAVDPRTILFGADETPRIVDVHPLLGRGTTEPAAVRLYQYSSDFAAIVTHDVPFYPFFFVSDIGLLAGMERSLFQFQELSGDNHYRYLVVFETWDDFWSGVRQANRNTEAGDRHSQELYLITNPVEQFLMQTGKTCFLGMDFDDLHRLQLDIEVFSSGVFPSARRASDEVIIIALSDNRGWERLLDARSQTEEALLKQLVGVIAERDPDVIEGHNIFAFDLSYLHRRCKRYGIPFALGRDGSEPHIFDSSMRFAERTVDYPRFEIAGRHIIDTYFQVMAYDVFKRSLPGYGLKAVARHFGFAPDGRTYVKGEDISQVWQDNPEELLSYALDDVRETERLARHLSGSTFYLTQMLPMPYGQVAQSGPAAKIESLFVREYLRQRHSIPKSEGSTQSTGGYTDIFVTGVVGPVVYADVESLYPSIMLNYDVKPRSDALELFPTLLRQLTDLRFEAKDAMKQAQEEESRNELDARQSSYKVLINSFYGNLGFSLAAFNDAAEADRVARIGQELLRDIIDEIRSRGGTVVEVDTDGVFFVPPGHVRGERAEINFTRSLSDALPEGIRVGFDGRYAAMLSYKKKNYALMRYDGSIKFKGSSLVSRSNEPFGRRFVRRGVRLLLEEDISGLHELYLSARSMIERSSWPDGVDSFKRTETLKSTIRQYETDVKRGKRTRAAAYELARRRAENSARTVRKGDRVSYYITGQAPDVTAFDHCRWADEWDPSESDENTSYYLRRLDQFARKFKAFFETHDFRRIFSPEDLFGFDPGGISIKTTHHENRRDPESEVSS